VKPRFRVRSEEVRRHLLRRNLSQNHLALKLAVSRGYLSQVLRGHRSPGPVLRGRLMDVLGVPDFDQLFVSLPEPETAPGAPD
jgi:transcriptional regulator with XRE-family HTH domain